MSDENEKRKLRLLNKLKKQWSEPSYGLWDQYLRLFDGAVKEAQISANKFAKIGEVISSGIFDKRASSTNVNQRSDIESVLEILTPTQQKIIQMTFWDGLSEMQIAKIIGVPRTTVSYQKHLAIRILRLKSCPIY